MITFKLHLENVFQTQNTNLHPTRKNVFKYRKAKVFGNTFIRNHFYYALLIWMFAGKFFFSVSTYLHISIT